MKSGSVFLSQSWWYTENVNAGYMVNKPKKWIQWVIRQEVLKMKLNAGVKTKEFLSHTCMRDGLTERWSGYGGNCYCPS